MTQTWRDLLFAHWPVPAHQLQPHVPAPLVLDQHSGSAWIAVVPFRMTDIRPLGLPAIPVLSETLELNVRTYTTIDGVPGVYFFSLDAASRLAVRIARRFFHLPYFDAEMSCSEQVGTFHFRSERRGEQANCDVIYHPTGPAQKSEPGSVAFFLTERYALYTIGDRGKLLRGRIHHQAWPLQPASAQFSANSMTLPLKLELSGAPLLYYSRKLDVSILDLKPC